MHFNYEKLNRAHTNIPHTLTRNQEIWSFSKCRLFCCNILNILLVFEVDLIVAALIVQIERFDSDFSW